PHLVEDAHRAVDEMRVQEGMRRERLRAGEGDPGKDGGRAPRGPQLLERREEARRIEAAPERDVRSLLVARGEPFGDALPDSLERNNTVGGLRGGDGGGGRGDVARTKGPSAARRQRGEVHTGLGGQP